MTPDLPAERAELLAGYNITWIPATAKEFAESVLAELEPEIKDGVVAVRKRTGPRTGKVHFDRVLDLASLPYPGQSEYLLGVYPTWEDITSGRAVAREFEERFDLEALPRCTVVHGTAGAGTTTTLMRLAFRLASRGLPALWLERDRPFAAHDVTRAIREVESPAAIFIDDADTLGRGLLDLTKTICAVAEGITLVLGLRSGSVDDVLEDWTPRSGEGVELVVPGLADSDVDNLIDSLDRDNKLGLLKGLKRERQRQILVSEAGRQLLVAMIKATSGEELQKRVASELKGLKQPHRDLYAAAAIGSTLRQRLTRDELLAAASSVDNTGAAALENLVDRRLLIDRRGSYELRHRLIAELAFDGLRASHEGAAAYRGLVQALSVKHKPGDRKSRVGRLVIGMINHRRIAGFFNASEVRNVYQSLEGFLKNDYHFWLQRGSYEVDHGSLSLAKNHLEQARNLGGGDYRVETEWAHYLMKLACTRSTTEDAAELVREAEEILLEQIKNHGSHDRYAYHVYGSQMLAWIHRAPMAVEVRKRLFMRMKEIVDQGAERHPRDRDLAELRDEIKREYMMTAVT